MTSANITVAATLPTAGIARGLGAWRPSRDRTSSSNPPARPAAPAPRVAAAALAEPLPRRCAGLHARPLRILDPARASPAPRSTRSASPSTASSPPAKAVTLWASGGTVATDADLVVAVTTSAGRTLLWRAKIFIAIPTAPRPGVDPASPARPATRAPSAPRAHRRVRRLRPRLLRRLLSTTAIAR